VMVLVTEDTLEENLLNTLSAKHVLALAALDAESDVTDVDCVSGIEELKRRLEVLLGSQGEAPEDVTSRERVERESERFADRRERVAAAGGELLGAVFNFLGELVAEGNKPEPPQEVVSQLRERLDQCVEEDASGRTQLSVTLPDRGALDNLAQALARLMTAGDGADAAK